MQELLSICRDDKKGSNSMSVCHVVAFGSHIVFPFYAEGSPLRIRYQQHNRSTLAASQGWVWIICSLRELSKIVLPQQTF